MVILENEFLKVTLQQEGAEMTSVWDKKRQRDCLWTADPTVWNRHAPVLFPVVGMCKNKEYRYRNKTYPMNQHGFARDAFFAITEQSDTKVVFVLKDSEETRAIYPFSFTLTITYELEGSTIKEDYDVVNTDPEHPMYFSIGGHPGFLFDGELKDQIFTFNSKENLDRLTLNGSAFSRKIDADYVLGGEPIHVTEHLFDDDALVFHNFAFTELGLVNEKTGHGVVMDLSGFPYVGLWSMPNQPYACIEPWFGLADYEDFEGELSEKDGIETLAPEAAFHSRFTMTFY